MDPWRTRTNFRGAYDVKLFYRVRNVSLDAVTQRRPRRWLLLHVSDAARRSLPRGSPYAIFETSATWPLQAGRRAGELR